jgi:trans-aconitate 2-methyltransferase
MAGEGADEAGRDDIPGWNGFTYEQISALQRQVGVAFIDALELSGVRRVLDVGCGDGFLTERLARRAEARGGATVEVLGVDLAPAMLARARLRSAPGLAFEEQDATAVRLPALVDLVISLNALHWVLDLGAALASMRGVLAPGGRAVLQFVTASQDSDSIEDVAMRVAAEPGWSSHFSGFEPPYRHPSIEHVTQLARDAGFIDLQRSSWGERFDFGTIGDFVRWCAAGMGAWTSHVPAERRESFVSEVVGAYVAGRATQTTLDFRQSRFTLR